MNNRDFRRVNEEAWDRLAREQHRFARPARERDLNDPMAAVDGQGWLEGDIRGRTVLCLAAGGGRQAPIYAAAGAIVTVVDISEQMLELDRTVASELGYRINIVKASMDRLTGLADSSFDFVVQPVSTCYVPDILVVFQEVARVMRGGGIYISQHKTPTSLQSSLRPGEEGYTIRHSYYQTGPVPPPREQSLIREPGTYEFVHRWEEIVGGMCRAGFVIEDLMEPLHADAGEAGSFEHRSRFIAPYVRIKARRLGDKESKILMG